MKLFWTIFVATDIMGFLMPVIIFAVVGAFSLASWYRSPKKRILRQLKKSPAKPINSVKDHTWVRLHGYAKPIGEPLIAPLSHRPCLYYHVRVEQKGSKNSWSTIINDFSNQDFYLTSGGEIALIKAQPKHRTLYFLMMDHLQKSGWNRDATPRLEAYLNKHGKQSETMLFGANKTLRYHEAIIEPGEQVVVKGKAKWIALDTPIAGYSYSRIVELTSTQKDRLIITDDPDALKALPKV